MNIEVTRDNVTILEQSETPHENEYKITTCYFTFDDFTSSFQVKRAIFTILSTEEMYETDIINNQCDIPSEVLKHEYETVKLGVYGYNIGDNDELLNRFSPSYAEIIVPTGSYKEGALSPEPITPSQYDLYSQALQEGLQEVDDKLDEVVETVDNKLEEVDDKLEVVDGKIQDMDDALDDVDTAITETNNLNLDVSDKVDGDVTVTLTKKDASTKSVVISDGTSLMFNWDGTKLGVKTDEDSEYVYVDLQGIQGVPGPQGEPFRIKKTYSSVAEMNADFNNMQYGDYVMIASTVEVEDNAKLYTRGESQWIFITDFSGATGIKGETGATPNIQIGTVTSGSTPSVTRTGTNEKPVLNFVLQPGEKGNKGDTGATGDGIASITKTSTSGLVDTYTITYTSGNTTTFNVTNGNGIDHISLTSQSGATKVYTIYFTDGNTTTFTVEDGEVTQEVFDEEIERANMIYNAMPKVSSEGTNLTLNNTAECPVYDIELKPSELEQESTTGKNLFNINGTYTRGNATISIEGNTLTQVNTGAYGRSVWTINGLTIGTKYTLSLNYSNANSSPITIQIRNSEDNINIGITSTTNTSGEINLTFEAEETTHIIRLYSNSSTTANTYTVLFNNIQLEQGDTATDYEEYTGRTTSPNPQYPQEIHTVSGENTITISNSDNIQSQTYPISLGNLEYCKIGDYEDEFMKPSGKNLAKPTFDTKLSVAGSGDTRTCQTSTNNCAEIIEVQSNTEYTISGDFSILKNGTMRIAMFDNLPTNASTSTKVMTSATTFTLTTDTNTKYLLLWNGNDTDTTISNLQVEEGNISTPVYEPYDNGKWYLKKNIGKKVFTGASSEGWSFNFGNCIRNTDNSVLGTDGVDKMPIILSNYYKAKEQKNLQDGNVDYGIGIRGKGNEGFIIRNKDWSSLAEYQNGLSVNNTTAYYPLATPTYTLLSDTLQTQLDNIHKAVSSQDQTNVSQTNADLPFVIKLSAIRDLSGIFELIQ